MNSISVTPRDYSDIFLYTTTKKFAEEIRRVIQNTIGVDLSDFAGIDTSNIDKQKIVNESVEEIQSYFEFSCLPKDLKLDILLHNAIRFRKVHYECSSGADIDRYSFRDAKDIFMEIVEREYYFRITSKFEDVIPILIDVLQKLYSNIRNFPELEVRNGD